MYLRIFYTAQNDIIQDIAGNPDHEQIPQALVKNDLRRDPGIRAAQNYGERMLAGP
jgi:hypothetical protein